MPKPCNKPRNKPCNKPHYKLCNKSTCNPCRDPCYRPICYPYYKYDHCNRIQVLKRNQDEDNSDGWFSRYALDERPGDFSGWVGSY